MLLSEIQIRDPFVLPVAEEAAYYLFGSTDRDIWSGPGTGFDCYRTRDLVNWEGPLPAFRPAPSFWGRTQFWAPKVHRVGERFFMLATFAPGGARPRSSQFLISARPEGPYVPHGEPVTPANWACLDATLHTEADGTRWIVFCQEWLQVHDGAMWALRLDDELRPMGRPVFLFNASEAAWSEPMRIDAFGMAARDFPCRVTDGPFLHRTAKGSLLMLWSTSGARGYAMGVSRSASGHVVGPWIHPESPLVADDGGHGMLFRRLDGGLTMTFHQPNRTPDERAVFVDVRETATGLEPLN